MTTNPEVAVLFAKASADDEAPSESVIYCFLEAGLKSVKDVRLTRINVDNLWRLEAQKGLFIQYLEERVTEGIRSQAIRIYFPASPLTAAERIRLYPVRKSALESIIDQWIYRRQVEEVTEAFKDVQYKFMTHRETYPGAFRWRAVPEFEASWFEQEPAWVFPPVESVAIINDPEIVTLRALDFATPENARQQLVTAIQGPIRQYRATGQLISFVANLSVQKSHLSGSVSTLINRCWDGLRVLRYRTDEMIASISLIALFFVARAEAVEGVDEWPKRFFGELKTIEIAPIGGHIEGGRVSRAERVVEQSKWIVEIGGISVLDVMPSVTIKSTDEIDRVFSGVGALEIWLISKGLIQEVRGKPLDDIKPIIDEFWDELMISNANIQTRAESAHDWPGPVSRR